MPSSAPHKPISPAAFVDSVAPTVASIAPAVVTFAQSQSPLMATIHPPISSKFMTSQQSCPQQPLPALSSESHGLIMRTQ
eukprot:CAMPEP_0202892518 /NCGR_PEP_ID=MMETSP1392-20130828/2237_1 /ASSEMBLY_ACC=CAM_ASM_000868 /TAXON_ID=225041 /ORGANISM="Chlamydomonas chlamydogama, Strain SAG 11-48b" /LENGTH=79 /DNA_ID=CAMNT_0049576507 /DNA_START=1550 /DNA_END=1789 /DNA_ORIENTATION=-